MSEIDKKHRKDVEEKVDEVKKSPFQGRLDLFLMSLLFEGIYF
jgi:hypothetical protein